AGGGARVEAAARALIAAGADLSLVGPAPPALLELAAAHGRPIANLDPAAPPEALRPRALLFDATAIADARGLRALYDFFHPLVGKLAPSGRVVVLARPVAAALSAEAAAAQAALEGVVRSLAKEIGRHGSTAQLCIVHAGAEERLEPVLRYLLSARAAFVSGQPITIDARAVAPPGPAPTVRVLEGKVALVTGAARGIGEATCRLLAAEGARVVCLDRPADAGAAAQLARAIGGEGLGVDIGDAGAARAIAEHVARHHGGVDVLVHNAGITRDKTLGRMPGEAWDAVIDVNLGAIARIDAALDQAGLLRRFGREICLASVAGIAGNLGQTNYAASKAGVAAYVRRRAVDLAERGITANAVAPGFIETRMTAAIPLFVREAGRRLSALGQGGQPADVGQLITFLASPGAAGVTGAVLRVCGGALIGA
ncbi:MAG TPA: 3-oxoacyl-ACP reductase, partial [Polyangia bacterium]|nr:3-oxoacyl-ACP reductase [Polyangia bacterium]